MYSSLSDMRVVEFSAFVAAPFCGMTLAQMGAEVIRIEPLEGALDRTRWPVDKRGNSLYWAGLNKGKKSILIDLKKPEGQELAACLATTAGPGAGLVLTNLSATGWLDFDSLKKRRPDIVMLKITGNSDGTAAVDYTVNAALGYPAITGAGHPGAPVNHVLPAWDIATGLTAATALLTAERDRGRTGEGRLIQIALSDVAMGVVGSLGHIAEVEINGHGRQAYGNDLFGAFGRDFPTADGKRIMLAAITRGQWRGLCSATGLTERMRALGEIMGLNFDREGERFEGRQAIESLIGRWCNDHKLVDIAEAFDKAGVCWGRYQTFDQLVHEDPRCSIANPMFARVEQPGIGTYLTPGPAIFFDGMERGRPVPAPVLGQHTEEVLGGVLGLGDAQIGGLIDRRVVGIAK